MWIVAAVRRTSTLIGGWERERRGERSKERRRKKERGGEGEQREWEKRTDGGGGSKCEETLPWFSLDQAGQLTR